MRQVGDETSFVQAHALAADALQHLAEARGSAVNDSQAVAGLC